MNNSFASPDNEIIYCVFLSNIGSVENLENSGDLHNLLSGIVDVIAQLVSSTTTADSLIANMLLVTLQDCSGLHCCCMPL